MDGASASRPEPNRQVADRYAVRRYRPADRSEVLDVLGLAGGTVAPSTWFGWAVEDNPFVDHVPISVATIEDRVVAVRTATAVPLLAGDATVLAYVTGPAAVRPAHLGEGLAARTLDHLADQDASRRPALLYATDEDGDTEPCGAWDAVGSLQRYCRIQQPGPAFAGSSPLLETVADLASPVVRSGLAAAAKLAQPGDDYAVRRHDALPVDTLASLYRRDIPDGLHAVRDRAYLSWRYHRPGVTHHSYTVNSDGEPVAAAIVGRHQRAGQSVATLTDVLPATGGRERRPALAALLARIVHDVADADVVTATGSPLSPSLLGRFGFVSAGLPPLDGAVGRPTLRTRCCRDHPQPGGSVGGHDLTDRRSWALSGSELPSL
ncbi:hypothetical protein ACKVMT_05615 [Halobacteriales archaeon Cl-PHB]